MVYFKKNKFLTYFATLIGIQLIIGLCTIFFLGFYYLPTRSLQEKQAQCVQHLEDKSYILKQFFLENINNAGVWVYSQRNSFFDSKWIGVSFYEHNGTEWVLKNFQVNSVLLDLYNISPSEYIKFEQRLSGPHPDASQISLQESILVDQKMLVIESSNHLKINSPHLVRISVMSDQIRSILDSNPACPLSLFDPKGNFLLTNYTPNHTLYITNSTPHTQLIHDISQLQLEKSISITKKILKSVSVVQILESSENPYSAAFTQILFFNFSGLLVSAYLAFRVLKRRFKGRIQEVKQTLHEFSNENYTKKFDTEIKDEFSEIEESLSELKDSHRRR